MDSITSCGKFYPNYYKTDDENEENTDVRKGLWTNEEDDKLVEYITVHGDGHWNAVARCSGLKRTGKSCRLRWLNYLRPNLRRGNLTIEEQLLILELHSRLGNRWSRIAQHLPGRTDNEIKNYWRSRVEKLARRLKCDVNSNQFTDAATRFLLLHTTGLLLTQEDSSSSSSLSLSQLAVSTKYHARSLVPAPAATATSNATPTTIHPSPPPPATTATSWPDSSSIWMDKSASFISGLGPTFNEFEAQISCCSSYDMQDSQISQAFHFEGDYYDYNNDNLMISNANAHLLGSPLRWGPFPAEYHQDSEETEAFSRISAEDIWASSF